MTNYKTNYTNIDLYVVFNLCVFYGHFGFETELLIQHLLTKRRHSLKFIWLNYNFKEERLECSLKNIEQNCFRLFLKMQQTYRGLLIIMAL